jgi:hypothetical protein
MTISIYRGEDVLIRFVMSPSEDVSAWSIVFTVRGADGVLISRTCDIDDGPAGEFSVLLADDDTDGLRPGTYLFDVWRTDEGSEHVLEIGDFNVAPVAREVGG